MADVKLDKHLLMCAVVFVAWTFASLSASAVLAEQRSVVPPYYLTITLVKSYLPANVIDGRIGDNIFSKVHKAATLQIELDVKGTTEHPYRSTTIARAFNRNDVGKWARFWLRGTQDTHIDHGLKDYVIVKNRRIYQEEVKLRVVYSATMHNITTLRNFLRSYGAALQVADWTYSGLASQVLRVFTQSSANQFASTRQFSADTYGQSCIIIQPRTSGESDERRQCAEINNETAFAYVELKLDVSDTIFPRNNDAIWAALDNYVNERYPKRVKSLTALPLMKGPQLEKECSELRNALDRDLVPTDRNLVLLRLLKKMKFDPDGEEPICSWTDQENAMRSLMKLYPSLELTRCVIANDNEDSQSTCQELGKFMRAWNGFGSYQERQFSWSVKVPFSSELDEHDSDVNELRKKYRLELRYGNYSFDRSRHVWKAAGVVGIYEKAKGGTPDSETGTKTRHVCSFPANITVSVGHKGVDQLVVSYNPQAQVRRSHVMDTDPRPTECRERA